MDTPRTRQRKLAATKQSLLSRKLLALEDLCDHAQLKVKKPRNLLSPKTWGKHKRMNRVVVFRAETKALMFFDDMEALELHLKQEPGPGPDFSIEQKEIKHVKEDGEGKSLMVQFNEKSRHPLKVTFLVPHVRDHWIEVINDWLGGAEDGLRVITVDKAPFGMSLDGITVMKVGGRAMQLGVQVGDTIVKVAEFKITDEKSLQTAFTSLHLPFVMRLRPKNIPKPTPIEETPKKSSIPKSAQLTPVTKESNSKPEDTEASPTQGNGGRLHVDVNKTDSPALKGASPETTPANTLPIFDKGLEDDLKNPNTISSIEDMIDSEAKRAATAQDTKSSDLAVLPAIGISGDDNFNKETQPIKVEVHESDLEIEDDEGKIVDLLVVGDSIELPGDGKHDDEVEDTRETTTGQLDTEEAEEKGQLDTEETNEGEEDDEDEDGSSNEEDDDSSDIDDEEGVTRSAEYWKAKLIKYRGRFKKLWHLHMHMREINRRLKANQGTSAAGKANSILEQERFAKLEAKLERSKRIQAAMSQQRDRQLALFEAMKKEHKEELDDLREQLVDSKDSLAKKDADSLKAHIVELSQKAARAAKKEEEARLEAAQLQTQYAQSIAHVDHANKLSKEAKREMSTMQKLQKNSTKRIAELTKEIGALREANEAHSSQHNTFSKERMEMELRLKKMGDENLASRDKIVALEAKLELSENEFKEKDDQIKRLEAYVEQASRIKNAREKAELASQMIQRCIEQMDNLRKCNAQLTHDLHVVRGEALQKKAQLRAQISEPLEQAIDMVDKVAKTTDSA